MAVVLVEDVSETSLVVVNTSEVVSADVDVEDVEDSACVVVVKSSEVVSESTVVLSVSWELEVEVEDVSRTADEVKSGVVTASSAVDDVLLVLDWLLVLEDWGAVVVVTSMVVPTVVDEQTGMGEDEHQPAVEPSPAQGCKE